MVSHPRFAPRALVVGKLSFVADDDGLTDAEVRSFIEEGFLWLRGCFSPEGARSIVAGVFGPRGSLARCARRTASGVEVLAYTGQSLSDCRVWGTPRADIETGFEVSIEDASPRLFRVVQKLTAPGEALPLPVGREWILNLDHKPTVPDVDELDRRRRTAYWHIDTPGTRTTLVGRFDALTLLILWSDVEEHGGGTLFAPDSLDRMIEALASSAEGLDTRAERFGVSLIDRCTDLRAQVGKAGDVLVLHPFMLHASPENYRLRVRILENPTVHVRRELDYRRTNPAPSPVEACVIRRLRALPRVVGSLPRHESERALVERAQTRLIEEAPSHFFPYVRGAPAPGGTARSGEVELVDRFLFESWIQREARAIAFHHRDPLGAARAVAALVRSLFATQRDLSGLEVLDSLEDPASLAARSYACLVLGFTNGAGMSYMVGRLLRATGHEVYAFRTARTTSHAERHTLVLLAREGGGVFVDAQLEVPMMWVEGFDIRRACRNRASDGSGVPDVERPLPGTPDHAGPPGPSREALLGGELLHPDRLDGPDPAHLRDAVESYVKAERSVDARATEVWRAFLQVRIRHLENTLTDPPAAYAALLEDPKLKGATRSLVEVMGRIASTRSRGAGADCV